MFPKFYRQSTFVHNLLRDRLLSAFVESFPDNRGISTILPTEFTALEVNSICISYNSLMNIVFAHFKTKFPKHLILNLQRTAKLFPEHQVVLITDQDVSKLDIQGLTMFFFDESPEWLEIESLLEHPKDFRGNFWFTSLARFVAISAFMQLNDCPLVHIESDVIISSDFPFEKFSKIESVFAYPVINDNLAIASCLFIRDKQAAMFLENFTLKSVREILRLPICMYYMIYTHNTQEKSNCFLLVHQSGMRSWESAQISLTKF